MSRSTKAPDDRDRTIGSILRRLRGARGLTQTELGESIGVTFQQVQKYENGTNRISSSRLENIAATLGVPVSTFFHEQTDGSQDTSLSKEAMEIATTYDGLGALEQEAVAKLISILSRH